jgi:presenilin-like A22 family membrane protease
MAGAYSYRPCQIFLVIYAMICGTLISAGVLCFTRFQCQDEGLSYILFGGIHGGFILVCTIVSGMIQYFCYRKRTWSLCGICEEV